MLAHVSEGFDSMIEGATDTEHLAALYMTYLCEPADFHGADKHYSASLMWKALKSAIHKLEAIQKGRGLTPDNFLNICASMCPSIRPLLSVLKHRRHCHSGWRESNLTLLPLQGVTFDSAF